MHVVFSEYCICGLYIVIFDWTARIQFFLLIIHYDSFYVYIHFEYPKTSPLSYLEFSVMSSAFIPFISPRQR